MDVKFKHKTELVCLMFSLFFCLFCIPVQSTVTTTPSSFYIEFEGLLQLEGQYFWVFFTNGSKTSLKNLTIDISIDKINNNEYTVNLFLDSEVFSREQVSAGEVVDGQLLISSDPSLFMVSPKLLNEGDNILIEETSVGKIFGDVGIIGRAPTAIPNHRIKARIVDAYYLINSEKQLSLTLGFDPNSGLLVSAGGILSDILLEQMGIESIYGGLYNLKSYSQDLDFVLVETQATSMNWVFIIIPPVLFVFLIFAIYHVNKKKKGKLKKSITIHKYVKKF